MLAVLGLTLATAGCRWPELLRARLLAENGTYLLGATFGQRVVGPDGQPSLSPGIVIWTGDDNASALMAPVGGTLRWSCPDPPLPCPGTHGVLRLEPTLSGEGNDAAPTQLIPQWIDFDGMDPASVEVDVGLLAAARGEDLSNLFGGGVHVKPGERLGQAAQVAATADWMHAPGPIQGETLTLPRRVVVSVLAAEYTAYLDPYLFLPDDVAGLGTGHQSLLGDVTPPELSGKDIQLYPQGGSTRLEPTNPLDPIPDYNVDGVLDLAVLARDQGAGACRANDCGAPEALLGVKSITYYVIHEDEPTEPNIGPVTVELRCLNVATPASSDPGLDIYRSMDASTSTDGFLYDLTAMRGRSDCGAVVPEAGALGVDTNLLANGETYELVVVTEDYGGNTSCTDASAPEASVAGRAGAPLHLLTPKRTRSDAHGLARIICPGEPAMDLHPRDVRHRAELVPPLARPTPVRRSLAIDSNGNGAI